jgi:glycerophosphoryl diester phosphodiesterase
MIPALRQGGHVWRIGHKGAAALAAENTLPSLAAALAHGVDVVEFDVLGLADGTLVLAHSDDLREVTHGVAHGRVGGRTLVELRTLAPALPTLDEALALLAERAPTTGIQVDLKWFGYEPAVVEAVRTHGLVERTLVSSFFARSLLEVGRLEPGLRLGLSYPLDRRGVAQRRVLAPVVLAGLLALRWALPRRIGGLLDRAGATVASLHQVVVTPAVVEQCHRRGAAVWAWTVDDPRAVGRLAAAGVDGIITNDPRVLAATLPA